MTTPGIGIPWATFTEVLVNGGWQRVVTSPDPTDVLQTAPVEIERGRADEQTEMPPSSLSESWLNNDGRYTPGNPLSPLYGHLNPNTPVRRGYLIASDTFLRNDASEWGISGTGNLWVSTGASRSVNGTQGVHSVNGTNIFVESHTGEPMLDCYFKVDYAPPFSDVTGGVIEPGNIMMRYLDADNYYLLRVTVETGTDQYRLRILRRKATVETFVGSVFDTGVAHVAGQAVSIAVNLEGRSFRAKVWPAGTPEPFAWTLRVSDYDPSGEGPIMEMGQWGVRSGVASGNTNAKPIVFAYDNVDVRMVRMAGDLTGIAPAWNMPHSVKTAAVSVKGILQRLSQGDAPIRSPLRRAYDGLETPPLAYWPCEDGPNAQHVASGLAEGQPMLYNGGPPDFASNTDFVCSAPLLQLNQADLTGEIPWHITNGSYMVRHLLGIPSGGTVNNDVILRLYFHNASIWFLDVMYLTGGSISIQIYDFNGTLLTNTGPLAMTVDGVLDRIQVQLVQNGANVDWGIWELTVGATAGVGFTGTFAGRNMGTAARVVFNPYRNIDGVTIGHVDIRQQITSIFDFSTELTGYVGELAAIRFLRLCDENGIDGAIWGDPLLTASMGVQRVASLVSLFRECAAAEQGLLFEPRSWSALMLRTRESMYAQEPRLVLDYSDEQVAGIAAPYDDAGLRNDITAERVGGSSFRSVKEQGSGPKNAGRPWEDPEAVGPYSDRVTVNVFSDSDLVAVADHALREGTAPETRYPQITVNLAAEGVTTDDTMALMATNIGDRIQVHSLQAADIYETVDQIVQGYNDTQEDQYSHRLTFNATQYSPWNTIVLDETLLDGDVFTFEALGTSETAIKITSRPPVDTDPSVFPYLVTVDGEHWNATACANGAAPQYISAGTVAHADNASVTPGLPGGGSTTGDILVMHTACRDLAATSAAPAGWNLQFNLGNVKVWTKPRGAAEVAPTVTISGGAAGCTHSARIYALRGVPEAPVTSSNQFSTAQNPIVAAMSTGVQANIALWFVWKGDAWGSMGLVEPQNTIAGDDPTAVGGDQSIGVQYRVSTEGYALTENVVPITGGGVVSARTLILVWGNPQVLTVERNANQALKPHNAGAVVALVDQASYLGR